MKKRDITLAIILLMTSVCLIAQENVITPDLINYKDTSVWVTFNRVISYDNGLQLDSKSGDGLLWLKDLEFENGKIELDIKGKDVPGKSFVGLAFHGLNDSTYDAVYFRAFNFKNPDRNGHSVQYISHPKYTWNKLRKEFPEEYENSINPIPEPNEWFNVTIIIKDSIVEVYVNNSENNSLRIKQLSLQKSGWIGFWVGNNSEGFFRNLKIIPE